MQEQEQQVYAQGGGEEGAEDGGAAGERSFHFEKFATAIYDRELRTEFKNSYTT